MPRSKKEEYDRLRGLINQWNVDHYDIFELSQPNEDLEFHGVVRFFFQGAEGANVVTKCIRVASTATTREVIDVLIEKFRPDMRMLSQNKYALYEVHVNGEERRLANDERPLYVQLNWGNDVREGRFLLRNEDHATVRDPALGFDKSVLQQDQPGFKRKLSKREKKEKKKRERERGKENAGGAGATNEEGVASKLYEEAPETSFTRSISNPEAVMRRRRQQKLEKKLAQMNTAEGGSDSGGTLKIYGESLRPDVPYKTLFLSTADPASAVVREAMEKYGLEKEDPAAYCLVEVLLPPGGMEYHGGGTGGDERVLHDNDCPLAIVMQHAKQRGQGHLIFQLRHRVADYQKRNKRTRAVSQDDLRNHQSDQRHINVEMLPYLLELNVRGKPRRHVLPLNVTEVVNANEEVINRPDYNSKHFLQLAGPDIQPCHCVIAHTEGVVTLTPNNQDAEIYVQGQRIFEITMLKHGDTVQFGKGRLYHFLDPRFDEHPMNKQPYPMQAGRGQPQETNFDVDGRVNTVGGNSPRPGSQAWDSMQRRSPGSSQAGPYRDDLLPASVQFFLDAESRLLQACILDVNSKQLQFKLAPTYTLYMAVRNLLSLSSPGPQHHAQLVANFVSKMANMAQQTIQEQHNDPPSLAFWMANCSEILHMLKQDRDLQNWSSVAQEMLAEAVQTAFHHLVRCSQGDLQRVMPAFLDPSDAGEGDDDMGQRYTMGRPTLADVLNTLSAAMTLLRRCRVNAALTIQLFSQLFHFINMWLFNILVTEPQLQLCTRQWGLRLKRRLGSVEAWAEKQGLELAADCHLCRIIQAAHLLQAPKSSADDITNISSTCFKLNSMQLRALLTRYIPEPNEPGVSSAFVERVVSIAENMADELTRTDGREVRLEEDNDLHLPFLLPEDGYSCDTIRGIPNGLPEFVGQLEAAGLCRFVINNHASGSWTVYMGDDQDMKNSAPGSSPSSSLPPTPEIFDLSFNKVKGSMGLSIVAATGEGQAEQGVYIKSVVEGGAAALDGRLQAGDQLLEVDGKSLIGLSQDKAAELMTKTGQVVRLKVAKSAVLYHNLGSLLSQPSPTSQRAAMNKGMPPNRGFNDEGPPPYDGRDQKPLNGYGDHDRGRLNEPYSRRDMGDSRSKSTSNLHVETNLDRGDMQHPHPNHSQMRPAQSVGVLHPASPGFGQYSPGGRHMDTKQNDYENQPRYPLTGDRNSYEGSTGSGGGSVNRPGYNFVDPRQNLPGEGKPPGPGQLQQQQLMPRQTSERSSVSSRASSGSNRPQSAYFDPQNMNRTGGGDGPQESSWSRPRSEDVGSKLKDWQDKYDDPWRAGKQYNDDKIGGGNNSPPYSNIGAHNRDIPPQPQHNPPPKPTAHERLFSNSSSNMHHLQQQHQQPHQQFPLQGGMPQRMPIAPPQHRQPNFYENTVPLQQAPPPAFHQLPQVRFPTDSESRPRPAPKPAANPARRGQPRVQHTEMPMVRVDGRGSQPQFYGDNLRSPMTHTVQQPGFNNAGPNQNNIGQQNQQNQNYGNNRGPDTRYESRNGPPPQQFQQPEFRGMLPQDGRNVPDLRHAPDPRNNSSMIPSPSANGPNYRSQQAGGVNQQQPELRNSYPQQQQPGFHPEQLQYSHPANDLPPPPAHNDLPPMPLHQEEELPPLPPPPSAEALLADEQAKLLQQINATNQFLATETGSRPKRYSPNTQQQQQQHQQQPYQQPPAQPQQQQRFQQPPQQQQEQQHQLRSTNPNQPRRVLPPGINAHDSTPMGYQVATDGYQSRAINDPSSQHNYQNINFTSDARAAAGLASQAPPIPQPPSEYESFDNPALRAQGFAMKPAVPANKPKPRDRPDANNRSAWDRDARERAEEQEQEELFKAREQEINDLESKSYLNPGEQERLRKLKMEHEFQRRVREIAEKGDYEYEDDDELAERLFTRERLISTLKEDLEKTRARHRDLEIAQQRADAAREQDRLQMLERRLEMYEKDKEEQRQRMQRKQDKRAKEHQEQLRQQRESREKQRQNFEEQKRQLMKEEEKMTQRREEEMSKRRQFERERRQEMQDKRDAEEKRARAEIRAEEEVYRQQQMALERQQRADQNRPISVSDERRRINSMNSAGNGGQTSPPGYSQYANIGRQNLDTQDLGGPPPPPQRNSSYEMFSQHQQRASFRGNNGISGDFPPPPPPIQNNGMQQALPPSAMKNTGEPPAPAKKSVSFNTQMNTYKDRTPSHSISSYQSPHGSQSSDPGLLPPPLHSLGSPEADVFDQNFPPPPSPPQGVGNNNNGPSTPTTPTQMYNTSSNTPNVIGAQEIYRDPRSKIEAKLASGRGTTATDKMSFKEKMKYFAQEAGEDTIKYKPKASKTLRSIESQLNGQ